MKALVNNTFKKRFFFQYFDKEIKTGGREKVLPYSLLPVESYGYLELRPLSSLTDYEAVEVAKAAMNISNSLISGTVERFHHPSGAKMSTITVTLTIAEERIKVLINQGSAYVKVYDDSYTGYGLFDPAGYVQTLLSMGIALPFMGYSVEDLVNLGLVKLTSL